MTLEGAKVVVTGGSSGYGAGIAAAFVGRGAKVWITGRDELKLSQKAAAIGATPVVADVTRGDDWDRVFATVGDDVDVLVNNAGAGVRIAPLVDQTDEEIEASVAVNLTGAMKGAARAARLMSRRRRGVIVNIASVCAVHAWPEWSVYTAAKAGLLKFSHALHTEMRPRGVRVTCVIPSWGRTNFNRAAGVAGASEESATADRCTAPDELGRLVADLVALPDHLTVPEVTIQPMIQDICPM